METKVDCIQSRDSSMMKHHKLEMVLLRAYVTDRDTKLLCTSTRRPVRSDYKFDQMEQWIKTFLLGVLYKNLGSIKKVQIVCCAQEAIEKDVVRKMSGYRNWGESERLYNFPESEKVQERVQVQEVQVQLQV